MWDTASLYCSGCQDQVVWPESHGANLATHNIKAMSYSISYGNSWQDQAVLPGLCEAIWHTPHRSHAVITNRMLKGPMEGNVQLFHKETPHAVANENKLATNLVVGLLCSLLSNILSEVLLQTQGLACILLHGALSSSHGLHFLCS